MTAEAAVGGGGDAALARVRRALAQTGGRLRARAAVGVALPGALGLALAGALFVVTGAGGRIATPWVLALCFAVTAALVAAAAWRAAGRGRPAEAALWLDAHCAPGEARFAAIVEADGTQPGPCESVAAQAFASAVARRCDAGPAAPAQAVRLVRTRQLLPMVAVVALAWTAALASVAARDAEGLAADRARARAASELRGVAAGAALPGEARRELAHLASELEQGRADAAAIQRVASAAGASAERAKAARERALHALRAALAGGGPELEALLRALTRPGSASPGEVAARASTAPGAAGAGEQLGRSDDPALAALGEALKSAQADRARAASAALAERLAQLAGAHLAAAGAVARVEAALRQVGGSVSGAQASATSVGAPRAPTLDDAAGDAAGGARTDTPGDAPAARSGSEQVGPARARAAPLPPRLAGVVERFRRILEEQ
jgi:hypothetical protein